LSTFRKVCISSDQILVSVLTTFKMWVSIDDWHENPDIIHTKLT